MEFPDDLKYTREHEWLLVEGNVATVGITSSPRNSSATWSSSSCPRSGTRW